MRPGLIIFLEGMLSFAIPIGWAVFELSRLNRRPPPDDPPAPVAPKPAPPRITVRLPTAPRHERVREDA